MNRSSWDVDLFMDGPTSNYKTTSINSTWTYIHIAYIHIFMNISSMGSDYLEYNIEVHAISSFGMHRNQFEFQRFPFNFSGFLLYIASFWEHDKEKSMRPKMVNVHIWTDWIHIYLSTLECVWVSNQYLNGVHAPKLSSIIVNSDGVIFSQSTLCSLRWIWNERGNEYHAWWSNCVVTLQFYFFTEQYWDKAR